MSVDKARSLFDGCLQSLHKECPDLAHSIANWCRQVVADFQADDGGSAARLLDVDKKDALAKKVMV
jgi:hypothetical protein